MKFETPAHGRGALLRGGGARKGKPNRTPPGEKKSIQEFLESPWGQGAIKRAAKAELDGKPNAETKLIATLIKLTQPAPSTVRKRAVQARKAAFTASFSGGCQRVGTPDPAPGTSGEEETECLVDDFDWAPEEGRKEDADEA